MRNDIGTLHFTGIGGIGMSGLAEILISLGHSVQGSDAKEGGNVDRLRRKGVRVQIGHDAQQIEGAAAVVVSSAIPDNNPEVLAARQAGIPVVKRADMLAELMRVKTGIAISGTHGKTTTTAMIGQMLEGAGFDPTVINGGIVHSYGTNVRLGAGDYVVAEADESDGSFTRLPAHIAVVTNIDPEHMEHYGDFDRLKRAYLRFITHIPFYGFAVLCLDHPEVQAIIPQVQDRTIVTYGFSPQADVNARNVRFEDGVSRFDVVLPSDALIEDVTLPMLGEHNVQNCLAAISIAYKLDVPADTIRASVQNFTGVKRRFTLVAELENGARIIDDYAHHPVEIETVLKTARSARKANSQGRVIAVMQPHRYSRLQDLYTDFCTCFYHADHVIILPVYAAGETLIEGCDHKSLAQDIAAHGHQSVTALDDDADLFATLEAIISDDDMILCLGAGDITALAHELARKL